MNFTKHKTIKKKLWKTFNRYLNKIIRLKNLNEKKIKKSK